MNTPVRIGMLSLIASISMMHGAATNQPAPAEQQPSNTAATVTTIAGDVGNIVTTATGLVQNHNTAAILASVGQFVQSIFSIVATLVHKRDMDSMEPMVVEVRQDLVERLVDAIDCSREYLKQVSLQELGCALQDAEREAIQMCANRTDASTDQLEQSIRNILNSLMHDVYALIQSSEENENIGASIGEMISNIIELAVDTIKYEREDDMEACAAMCVDRVCAELNRQIRHLMVQSALTLRGSACSVACIKNPGRPCAAAINMVMGTRKNCGCCRPSSRPCCNSCSTCNSCNQNTNSCCCNGQRSMSNICDEKEMRGCGCSSGCSTCKPNCNCKVMDMEMSDAEMRGCGCGCKPSSSSSCTTCNKPSCSCSKRSMDMCDDEQMRGCGCGCRADCTTCVSMNCEGSELRCPCNQGDNQNSNKPKPSPTVQTQAAAMMMKNTMMADSMRPMTRVIVKCECGGNRPNQKITQNSPQAPQRLQVTPSRKDGHRVLPEGQAPMRRRNMR